MRGLGLSRCALQLTINRGILTARLSTKYGLSKNQKKSIMYSMTFFRLQKCAVPFITHILLTRGLML